VRRNGLVVTFLCFFSLLIPAGLWAQGVEATLKGRVTDSSGGAVPNAKIEVRNTGTNVAVATGHR
jgi:hypothetical protein